MTSTVISMFGHPLLSGREKDVRMAKRISVRYAKPGMVIEITTDRGRKHIGNVTRKGVTWRKAA